MIGPRHRALGAVTDDHERLPAALLRRCHEMSRRCHHGSPRHPRPGAPPPRRRPASPVDRAAEPNPSIEPEAGSPAFAELDDVEVLEVTAAPDVDALEPLGEALPGEAADPAEVDGRGEAVHARASRAPEPLMAPGSAHHDRPVNGRAPHPSGEIVHGSDAMERTATAPQLRRFIKSRAYVPMHELRRRFVINGGDDDVTPIDVGQDRIYVGLPPREGSLLGELFRAGDIGYELSMDPIAPIVVGVYPMRPVPRG